MKYVCLFLTIAFLAACSHKLEKKVEASRQESKPKKQRPVAKDRGKFFDLGEKRMLFGGKDSIQHFDISNCELKEEQFHYGLGRELFPALLEPEFISVQAANYFWNDSARFLLAYSGNEAKAYSVKDLTRHEVVNDVLEGKPIMAAYCILADLGAIYERQYANVELTFALSGYTYYDDKVWSGLDGFILWDRETESLWWPLIDKAVSGPLKGVKLYELDKAKWKDTTWGEIKRSFPHAKVLTSGQDFERPQKWNRLQDVSEIIKNYRD